MDIDFWHHMVRRGLNSSLARDQFDLDADEFYESPVWCFHRFGSTRTRLADGTVVCIGGEHEDSYDPDFCIYNDVIVVRPDQSIATFGYPRDVFPPTDSHTATLCGDQIVIIGRIGYREDRDERTTPVFSLNLKTWAIERLRLSGESPGYIYNHRATPQVSENVITVSGGKRLDDAGVNEVTNDRSFALDLSSGSWREVSTPQDPNALPNVDWPPNWEPLCEENAANYERNQLSHSMPLGHPFFACELEPWATGRYADRWATLYVLTDGTRRVAAVFSEELEDFEHSKLPLPNVRLFPNIETWLRSPSL
ncbi:MAG: hypothetical protein H7Z14_15580 [Anaerolineae bacterium]|nr:hypothetical protein [Phycisphaerae bacterium]